MSPPNPLNRRQFVVGLSAGMGAATCSATDGAEPRWWQFFTNEEAQLVDAIAEQIIPGDQDAGGHDAGVVHFIDRQLVGHYKNHQETYRRGLVGLQETSRELFGQGFLKLTGPQQTELLKRLESGSAPGATWNESSAATFFRLVRDHSLQGFYGSPRHGGNRDYVSYRMLQLDYPQIIGRHRPREES